MKKQILSISAGSTAKVLILSYLLVAMPIGLIGTIVLSLIYGSAELGKILSGIVSGLLLNAVVLYVLLWIACHAYNLLAPRVGGIEIALADPQEEA